MKAIDFGVPVILTLLVLNSLASGDPVSTSKITYQGQLTLNGEKVNHPCDFEFCLFDAAVDGTQIACTSEPALPVDEGVFTVTLDFGAEALQSQPLWLEIRSDCTGEIITLSPRQQVTAVPFSLHTKGIAVDTNNNASVDGMVESRNGGFMFPDGTTMISANQLVPVGTVVDFFLDPAVNPIPSGWEICDGNPVQDPESPIVGMTKPNFTTPRFVRGTSNPGQIGGVGGSLSVNVNYTSTSQGPSNSTTGTTTIGTAAAGSSTNSVGLTTSSGGDGNTGNKGGTTGSVTLEHNHIWAKNLGLQGLQWFTYDQSGSASYIANELSNVQGGSAATAFSVNTLAANLEFYTNKHSQSHNHSMPSHSHSIPSHTHSISGHSHTVNEHTHGGLPHSHSMDHTHATNHNVDVTLPEPPYVGMLKIIKVK